MIPDSLIEDLKSAGESSTLDYKVERYKFAKASDEEKSELLKDILAMANTQRQGNAYILIGFKENVPYPAEVVGLPIDGAIDDSRIQEFVNSKLDNKLTFQYEEQMFEGKHIAVVTIPKQPRPFYVTKPYGRVEADTVYLRRGSSTGKATPREIYRMGATDHSKGAAVFDVEVLDEYNRPLEDHFERRFLTFDGMPDYCREQAAPFFAAPNYISENREYWRDGAEYYHAKNCLIRIRLALTNRSNFSLSETKLEVTWKTDASQDYRMLTADEIPDLPSEVWNIGVLPKFHMNGGAAVDEDGLEPVYQAKLGGVRPGETCRGSQDLAFLPTQPGVYTMVVRVLANELSEPQLLERQITVTGESKHLNIEDLQGLLDEDEVE